MDEPPEEPVVSRDGKGFIDIDFIVQGKPVKCYWIREKDVDSPAKLIAKLRHLSDKEQVIDLRHIAQLIDVSCYEVMRVNPHTGR